MFLSPVKNWAKENTFMCISVVLAVGLHLILLLMISDIFKPDMIQANVSAHRVSVVERPAEKMPIAQEAQKTAAPSTSKASQQKSIEQTLAKETPKPIPQAEGVKLKEVKATVAESAPKLVAPKLEPQTKPATKPETKPEPLAKQAPSLANAAVEKSSAKPLESQQAQVSAAAQPTQSEQEDPVVAPKFKQGSPQNPDPDYPSLARRRGWEGDVVLGVHVDKAGVVTYVEILKTSDISALDFAAYTTVKNEWRFDPARDGEQAVKGYVVVPISFRLK